MKHKFSQGYKDALQLIIVAFFVIGLVSSPFNFVQLLCQGHTLGVALLAFPATFGLVCVPLLLCVILLTISELIGG